MCKTASHCHTNTKDYRKATTLRGKDSLAPFLARDSMLSALYAIARPSVCPSVCPSVRHTGGSVENG